MHLHKSYIALGLLIALILFLGIMAHAEEANEQIRVTFNKPVQIPGQVLAAGTYTFQLADPDGGQHFVQIFNADRTVLYATVATMSAERAETTGDVALTLAESQAGKPDLLLTWFYPDSLTGHAFIYSKQTAKRLAQTKQEMFVGSQLAPNAGTNGE